VALSAHGLPRDKGRYGRFFPFAGLSAVRPRGPAAWVISQAGAGGAGV